MRDQAFRGKARRALKSRCSEGRAVVFVSQFEQQLKIKNLCSRVVWLEKSGIHCDGEPDVVLSAYADSANVPV